MDGNPASGSGETGQSLKRHLLMRIPCALRIFLTGIILEAGAVLLHAILSGDEFGLPEDSPSGRLDPESATSPLNFVGALDIALGGSNYIGTGSALSRHWVLSAGHNVDFNDDGAADADLGITFALPGFGEFAVAEYRAHPAFSGFGNPGQFHDLSLLYLATPLPEAVAFPLLGKPVGMGEEITLSGFGRSGYGSYGYTSDASLTDRRIGYNILDSVDRDPAGSGSLFRYDFDDPVTTGEVSGSLGNDRETLIGPGDSGGPALVVAEDGLAVVGVNTFVEGYGGRFGDFGGGVLLEDYWGWVGETTGLAVIPEPRVAALLAGLAGLVIGVVRRRRGLGRGLLGGG